MLPELIFWTTVVALVLLDGTLLMQLIRPSFRVWPPPSRRSWQFVFVWGLTGWAFVGFFALCWLDRGSLNLPWALRWLALVVGLMGLALAVWGVRTLSTHAALGLGGPLVTQGPYRFTRNPQYVGDILFYLGLALFVASWRALVVALLGSLWFFLAPFTEEPWLKAQFGPAYEAYMRRVPRFLSWRSLQRLFEREENA